MIVGLAISGNGDKALDMFSQMLRASIKPDEVAYVGVLSACTHNGNETFVINSCNLR